MRLLNAAVGLRFFHRERRGGMVARAAALCLIPTSETKSRQQLASLLDQSLLSKAWTLDPSPHQLTGAL
jgi:hypothetical protein